MIVMPFGKYKDYDIETVPNSYLEWLLEQEWVEEKYSHLIDVIEEELETRKRSYIYIT